MPITIYHNPRCSKSRQTLDILNDHNCNPDIVEYLQNPPSATELQSILEKLQLNVQDIIRTGEAQYKELKLADKSLSDSELLSILSANPKIIERPIVVNGDKACIGRPPENVLDII